jgi:hypothetical protein
VSDRCTLHRKRIEEFKAWASALGWAPEESPRSATYEVFRMRHADRRHPFIAYDRGSPEHVSVPRDPDGKDSNMRLVRRFIRFGGWE